MRASTHRITSIDAFRGFALAGIAIAHMVDQYIAAQAPESLGAVMNASIPDRVIQVLVEIFVRGKFFAMFAFLFGVSFFIQMDNAARKGIDFQTRFLWRVALLFLIGYLHSMFYRGDILTIFAMLGMLLVFFHRVPTKICLAIVAVIVFGLPRFVLFWLNGTDPILAGGDMNPELPRNVDYFDVLLNGTLLDVFAANAWHGHVMKMEFQLNVMARFYLTFAYFLLGLCVARSGLFSAADKHKATLKRALWWAAGIMIVALVVMAFLFMHAFKDDDSPGFSSWPAMIAFTFMDIFNLSMAAVFLCGFLLVFLKPRGQKALGALAPYGRMALTNYVLQTLIGTFILYNWGLRLLGEVSNTQTVAMAVAIIAAQVTLSRQWLRHFRFGPLEWLWRSGTYREWQALRR
ncbi:MAG: DUF418 domain-containing protein [Woeseiaceae bacterium]|nr:DUF418 domain-containing protein [Woeseiaceae bacterium]